MQCHKSFKKITVVQSYVEIKKKIVNKFKTLKSIPKIVFTNSIISTPQGYAKSESGGAVGCALKLALRYDFARGRHYC